MRSLVLLICALIIGPAAHGAPTARAQTGSEEWTSDISLVSPGWAAVEVHQPGGAVVNLTLVNLPRGQDYAPLVAMWFPDGGTPRPLPTDHAASHDAKAGEGDGVVHAGVGDSQVISPAVSDPMHVNPPELRSYKMAEASGILLVAWDRFDSGDMRLSTSGGGVQRTWTGTVLRSFELQDLGGGARAGVPAAARLHLGDSFQVASPRILFWTLYFKGDIGQYGRLAILGSENDVHVDMSRVPDAMDECICPTTGVIIGESHTSVRVEFDYAGETRSSEVYGLVLALPHEIPELAVGLHHRLWDPYGPPNEDGTR